VTGVSKSKDCLSRSQVYVTGVSKSKDCLSRSQVYVTGVSESKDCLSRSQVYINLTARQAIFALTNLCCVLSGEVTNTSLSLCLEVQTMMEWQDIFWL
jgi:hypothetical protein